MIFLIDKVRAKTQGWTKRLLSQVGSEILIKVVLQVMSSYSRALFRIPILTINKLNIYIKNFGGDNLIKVVDQMEYFNKLKEERGPRIWGHRAF